MEKLVVATNNKGKLNEFKEIFKGKFQVLGQAEASVFIDVEETGESFYENALLKARAVYDKLKCNVLADDSGLVVESLNGAPGIYSARYAEGGSENCMKKLLKELEGAKNRNAKFVCQLVMIKESGEIISAVGETAGSILYYKRGDSGFGYDPVFYSAYLQKSFGEASEKEKNTCSHRFFALKNLKEKL